MAATMGSETTAAAAGAAGRGAPRPVRDAAVLGYNMSDYFATGSSSARSSQASGAKLPKIFCVNWFRKGDDGKFVWPGFGENMRVLKWMLERVEGGGTGVEHVFGVSPRYADLNWNGLSFSAEQYQTVIGIDKAAWQQELKLRDKRPVAVAAAARLPAARRSRSACAWPRSGPRHAGDGLPRGACGSSASSSLLTPTPTLARLDMVMLDGLLLADVVVQPAAARCRSSDGCAVFDIDGRPLPDDVDPAWLDHVTPWPARRACVARSNRALAGEEFDTLLHGRADIPEVDAVVRDRLRESAALAHADAVGRRLPACGAHLPGAAGAAEQQVQAGLERLFRHCHRRPSGGGTGSASWSRSSAWRRSTSRSSTWPPWPSWNLTSPCARVEALQRDRRRRSPRRPCHRRPRSRRCRSA